MTCYIIIEVSQKEVRRMYKVKRTKSEKSVGDNDCNQTQYKEKEQSKSVHMVSRIYNIVAYYSYMMQVPRISFSFSFFHLLIMSCTFISFIRHSCYSFFLFFCSFLLCLISFLFRYFFCIFFISTFHYFCSPFVVVFFLFLIF